MYRINNAEFESQQPYTLLERNDDADIDDTDTVIDGSDTGIDGSDTGIDGSDYEEQEKKHSHIHFFSWEKLCPHCLVLVSSKNGYKCDFTIELK